MSFCTTCSDSSLQYVVLSCVYNLSMSCRLSLRERNPYLQHTWEAQPAPRPAPQSIKTQPLPRKSCWEAFQRDSRIFGLTRAMRRTDNYAKSRIHR
jgi:hypothetical protein